MVIIRLMDFKTNVDVNRIDVYLSYQRKKKSGIAYEREKYFRCYDYGSLFRRV